MSDSKSTNEFGLTTFRVNLLTDVEIAHMAICRECAAEALDALTSDLATVAALWLQGPNPIREALVARAVTEAFRTKFDDRMQAARKDLQKLASAHVEAADTLDRLVRLSKGEHRDA